MFAAIALDPLGEDGLDFGAAAVAGEAFLHNALHAVAHLAGGGSHTEAEFGVVLEQRVGPSGTESAAVVLAVGCGRSRAAVDGGASRGVGHHHLLAEELGDALEVRGLAAAGAGAAERSIGFAPLLLNLCPNTASLLCADYDTSSILR